MSPLRVPSRLASVPAAAAIPLVLAGALALAGPAQAAGTTSDCGAATVSGATAISSYSQLQSDLAKGQGGTYYLTKSIADSASTTGGLLISSDTVTLDLNGCTLSVTDPGAGNAAIHLASGSLSVEDLSQNADGTLVATGGPALAVPASTPTDASDLGAGAGIGGSGASPTPGGSFTLLSGTVDATGGTSAAVDSYGLWLGAGAGVGGAGGAATADGPAIPAGNSYTGQNSNFDFVGGTLEATGGDATADIEDTNGDELSGAGAGIGGGGGGSQLEAGSEVSSGSSFVDEAGGTEENLTFAGADVTATGGSTSSGPESSVEYGGAGAGIGGGGGGSLAANGVGQGFVATGGSITVSPGTDDYYPVSGFGNGGIGNDGAPSTQWGQAQYASGTTTIAGTFGGSTLVDGNATLAPAPGDAVNFGDPGSLYGGPNDVPTSIYGTLEDPSGFEFYYDEDVTVYNGGNWPGGLYDEGSFTLAGGVLTLPSGGGFAGGFTVGSDGALVLPAGSSTDIESANDVNDGTIYLGGQLGIDTDLDNEGVILPSSTASFGSNVSITGNDYTLTFGVPFGASAPPNQTVYAPTLAAAEQTLPSLPAASGYTSNGYWTANGSEISDGTPLAPLSDGGTIALVGSYTASSSGGGSTSAPLIDTTIAAPTASNTDPVSSQPLVLSTTVSAANGSTVNGGEVAFFLNGFTTACIAEVTGGTASCQTPPLPAGQDVITATYEGNTTYALSAVSGPLTVTVEPNNIVEVTSTQANVRTASVRFGLRVPDAGTVVATAAAGKRTVARATARRSGKGTVTVTLHLDRAERAQLARHHAITLKVRITFTPRGGRARTVTKTVRLK